MKTLLSVRFLLGIGAIVAASACNFPARAPIGTPLPIEDATQTSYIVTATSFPGTGEPAASRAPENPTSPPPATRPSSLSPTSEPPASPPSSQKVQIYLVALEDHGVSGELIGCGDSLIPVTVEIAPTQGVLRAALETLLGINETYYGQSGLYNALYQSDLRVENVRIESGLATIQLSGRLSLGGVCDNPRVEGQLRSTARQFSTVQAVEIFINGTHLSDLLSLK